MLSGGKTQKGCGIVRKNTISHLLYHSLVAAHLHVFVGADKGDPDQGIEPVDTQCQKCQRLYNVVTAPNVMLLMADDIGLLPLLYIRGQVDLWPEQAHDKG